jgi:hypothetical protein
MPYSKCSEHSSLSIVSVHTLQSDSVLGTNSEKYMLNVKAAEQSRRGRLFRREVFVFALAMAGLSTGGCSSHQPPEAKVTWLDSVELTPKPRDCSMPVLSDIPLSKTYRKVAIVEAWGNADQQIEVLEAVRQGACKIGADALLMTSTQSQYNGQIQKRQLPADSDQADTTSSEVRNYKATLVPRIGEAGHPGYYIDTVAIVYSNDSVHIGPSH